MNANLVLNHLLLEKVILSMKQVTSVLFISK